MAKLSQSMRWLVAALLVVAILPLAGMGIPGRAVTVITPNGGERWKIGTVHTIQWQAVELGGPFHIEIQRQPRGRWQNIALVDGNDHYDWKVTGPVTNRARIRVTATDPGGSYSDVSDGVFSIYQRGR